IFSLTDFLPVKCDACSKVFCNHHIQYASHSCPESYRKNVQVPICPLCGIAVPIKKGEMPDIRVGEHIDNNCNSDVALSKQKVYANRCQVKGCKGREVIPIHCPDCNLNFCLRHRHGSDHDCRGVTSVSHSQIRSSLPLKEGGRGSDKPSQEEEDLMLARAIAASEQEYISQNRDQTNTRSQRTPMRNPCNVS
ncbi:unnamed protein product, partial [Darwinula stevensoni]